MLSGTDYYGLTPHPFIFSLLPAKVRMVAGKTGFGPFTFSVFQFRMDVNESLFVAK